MQRQSLVEILACPRTDQSIAEREGELYCKAADTTFPTLAGVPFLFADPALAVDEWRERYHARLREIEHEAALFEQALTADRLPQTTQERLRRFHAGLMAHRDELTNILQPLDVSQLVANRDTYLALRTRLPSDQGLANYYANLHRDWCWGDDENRRSHDLVNAAIGSDTPRRMAVLGAGGGRLAYDLHQTQTPKLTVAVDFNPLLAFAAERIMRGESLALHEFPIAPLDSESVVCPRTLRAPQPVADGFHNVLANVLRAPFKPQSFDLLVTPWLGDVLPEPLPLQAARWNNLLEPGGRWIWFGSHVFRTASPVHRFSIEETTEIVEAAGFSRPDIVEAEIPYMVSPANRHARSERVVVMTMTKRKDATPAPRYVALPDWLVRTDLPVPTNESFQSQAMSTRIHAFLMSMIDGQRTISDMAELMESERLMPKAEAEATLRNFLIRMYEESQSYRAL